MVFPDDSRAAINTRCSERQSDSTTGCSSRWATGAMTKATKPLKALKDSIAQRHVKQVTYEFELMSWFVIGPLVLLKKPILL